MNDRFRFRAWKQDEKYMLDWRELKNMQTDLTFVIKDYSIFDDEKLILMQSTGLRDKNGVLIFEGDVVDIDLGLNFIVVFYQGGWHLEDLEGLDSVGRELLFVWKNRVKILGNKFENPELLKRFWVGSL